MKNKRMTWFGYGLLALWIFALGSAGCATSGGKQQTALANSSVGRDLKGDVKQVTSHSQDALKDLGVTVTDISSRSSGAEQDLAGASGAHQVSVRIHDIGNGMSHVEVSVKDGEFQWNQDYARNVLEKIIAKS